MFSFMFRLPITRIFRVTVFTTGFTLFVFMLLTFPVFSAGITFTTVIITSTFRLFLFTFLSFTGCPLLLWVLVTVSFAWWIRIVFLVFVLSFLSFWFLMSTRWTWPLPKKKTDGKWAMSRQKLSLWSLARYDSNLPTNLQRLARVLVLCTKQLE